MPTIGNVNRGTNLTHHFFLSKVGVGRRFQYGGRRRSLSPRACADEQQADDFDMCFTQKRPEIVRNTCAKIVKLDCNILFVVFCWFQLSNRCQIAG